MADDLYEAFVTGARHGDTQRIAQERTDIERERNQRLSEALAQRVAATGQKNPVVPSELLMRATSLDGDPKDQAAALAEIGSKFGVDAMVHIAGIGSASRRRYADALTQPESDLLNSAVPGLGAQPGVNRSVATTAASQRGQTYRQDDRQAAKPPPLSNEEKIDAALEKQRRLDEQRAAAKEANKKYYEGYVAKESDVPEAVGNDLARRVYGRTLDGLMAEETIQTGAAKGMSGPELAAHLTRLGSRAQQLAQAGTPLPEAINQMVSMATVKKQKRLLRDKPVLPPIDETPVKPPAAFTPPPVQATGDDLILRVLRRLNLQDTPENRARVQRLQGAK